MERSAFIKKLTLAGASLSLLQGCSNTKQCIKTPADEEGPFPTKEPVSLTTQNIVADRVGVPLTIKIIINNINNKCMKLPDAFVDIWHCDHKGEYSEYGGANMFPPPGDHGKNSMTGHDKRRRSPGNGGGMQATDYTDKHFLRGRQTTNADGIVSFTSIFPGWYHGRAPHIHAHIFDKTGKSLLITQIALPEEISQQVYAEGVYKDHGLPDTSNASDHIFRDSIANELASITGNAADGYILTHSIYVKA